MRKKSIVENWNVCNKSMCAEIWKMDTVLKVSPITPKFVKLSYDFQPNLATLPMALHLSVPQPFLFFLGGLTNDVLRVSGKETERGRESAWQRNVQANRARENAENK